MRLLSFCLRMIRSILETALASYTEIIRTYTDLTKTRRGGEGAGGEADGLSCLIDSVKRRAGDVNGWVIPFPRSGQMAVPCPGGRWQTARRGPGPRLGEPTAVIRESISHPLPSQKCWTKGRGCRARPLPCAATSRALRGRRVELGPGRNLHPPPAEVARGRGFWSRWRKGRSGQMCWDANSPVFLTNIIFIITAV